MFCREKMPRKTRKQKERMQKTREVSLKNQETENLVKREFSFSFNNYTQVQTKKSLSKKNESSSSLSTAKTVNQDLIKTFVIGVLIFTIELVIYLLRFNQVQF